MKNLVCAAIAISLTLGFSATATATEKPAPFICGENLDCTNYDDTVKAMEEMVEYLKQTNSNNLGGCQGALRSVKGVKGPWPNMPLAPKKMWVETCNRSVAK